MTTSDNERFDATARDLYTQATSQLSAGTMARLHQRRHAALSGKATRRSLFGWPVATAFASVRVVAIGLGVGLQDAGDPSPPVPATPVATAAPLEVYGEDALATLDENPEFFLWLASSDANLLAME